MALWARFEHAGRTAFGTLEGGLLRVHAGTPFDGATDTGETVPLGHARLRTPCEPSKLVGLVNNYRAAAERQGTPVPAEPLWFLKAPSSYRAHGEGIRWPAAYDGRVIYEGELGIVIGREARDVAEADATPASTTSPRSISSAAIRPSPSGRAPRASTPSASSGRSSPPGSIRRGSRCER